MAEKKDKTNKLADNVIRNHVIWSMGAGLIPILVADIFAVSALQVDMIKQLCDTYDKDFEISKGKAYVTSLTSSTLARLGARSLMKLIPGVGTYVGGVAVSVFAGASTYALGQVFKAHFASGGTILDFDPDRVKKYYQEMFEKGKQKAREWKSVKADEQPIVTQEEDNQPEVSEAPQAPVNQEKEVIFTPPPKEEEEPDLLTKLQQLASLKESGAISEEEFFKLKKKLIDNF